MAPNHGIITPRFRKMKYRTTIVLAGTFTLFFCKSYLASYFCTEYFYPLSLTKYLSHDLGEGLAVFLGQQYSSMVNHY